MEANPRHYWFPAKTYGWGWGPPSRWQGWAVILAYILTLLAGGFAFRPRQAPLSFAIVIVVATAAVIAVCYWKGEPPKWRWGKK